VEKIGFSMKTSKWTYGLETERTVQSITMDVRPRARTYGSKCDKELYFHQPSHSSCFLIFRVVLVEIELMIGIFSIFEVMEPQGNYMEELYDLSEYKLI
jgi:hypothetical protein